MLGTARKLLLFDGGAIAPVVEQDTGSQTTGGATSDTATFANTTVTGRGVIVVLALKGARQVSTITDNKSNTYVRVGRAADSTDCSVEMWYAQPITGGASHQITVTFDGTTYCVWGALEASRVKGGGAFLDTRTVNTKTRGGSGSSAAVSISSGLPRSANELFVAMVGIAGGGADAGIDTPSAWTNLTLFQDYDGTMAGHGDHRINVNANTVSATWTNDTTTSPYAAIIAGFRGENGISGGIAPPVNTVAPAITGTTTEGQTLTCSTGTWSNSPASYTYQWKDDGVAISGAVASTYVLTASEVGATITCTVTAYNDGGSASATATGVGPIGANTVILDSLSSSATSAFSVKRKLRASYAGSAFRVRRSSDSTEQDIGFVNNVVDTASLLSFCGAGDGFVVTWYDQSGSGRDVTQATAASQAKIVSSGALITTINGEITLQFDGTDDYYQGSGAFSAIFGNGVATTTAAMTAFQTMRPTAGGGASTYPTVAQSNRPLVADTGGGIMPSGVYTPGNPDYAICYGYNGTTGRWVALNIGEINGSPSVRVIMMRYASSTIRGYANDGTSSSDGSAGATLSVGDGTNRLRIGRSYQSSYYTGTATEIILFNAALSTADVNTLGTDMASEAGISWTTYS